MQATLKERYDINKFKIIPNRHGVTVSYNGKFWESADSYQEAEKDIESACSNL